MLFTSKQSLNTNLYDFFFQFTQQQPLKGVITLFLLLFKSTVRSIIVMPIIFWSTLLHFNKFVVDGSSDFDLPTKGLLLLVLAEAQQKHKD